MKVLLELLGDVAKLLGALDELDSLRPEARGQIMALLETLNDESERLMAPRHDAARREEFFSRALEAIAHQRFEEAEAILAVGVQRFPEDVEFHNHRGLVAWELGDIEGAVEHYHRAMNYGFPTGAVDWFDPSSMPFLRAMEGKALGLYRLGEHREARDLFESLASMNPAQFCGCRYLAGEILHKEGEVERALETYRLVPSEPAVVYNIGLAHFQLGDRARAAQIWVSAFVANPHIAHGLMKRGDAPMASVPGFVASADYADEFLDACADLWHSTPGAVRFLSRCYENPLVQAHLTHCTRRVMESVLQDGPGVLGDGWYREVSGQGVEPIVRSILEHMDS